IRESLSSGDDAALKRAVQRINHNRLRSLRDQVDEILRQRYSSAGEPQKRALDALEGQSFQF
ncbi:hypothetical protein AAVH_42633, partial [Aphelenchoides avenae]